jgi:hypothetical protein
MTTNTDSPMTPAELIEIMAILHWSTRVLAAEARDPPLDQNTVYRWRTGVGQVPADLATWLRDLAAYVRSHRSPRRTALEPRPAARRRTRELAKSELVKSELAESQ